jgi:hypothetical protein
MVVAFLFCSFLGFGCCAFSCVFVLLWVIVDGFVSDVEIENQPVVIYMVNI